MVDLNQKLLLHQWRLPHPVVDSEEVEVGSGVVEGSEAVEEDSVVVVGLGAVALGIEADLVIAVVGAADLVIEAVSVIVVVSVVEGEDSVGEEVSGADLPVVAMAVLVQGMRGMDLEAVVRGDFGKFCIILDFIRIILTSNSLLLLQFARGGRGGGIGYNSGPGMGGGGQSDFNGQADSGYGGGGGGGGFRGDLKRDSGHGGYEDRDSKRPRY